MNINFKRIHIASLSLQLEWQILLDLFNCLNSHSSREVALLYQYLLYFSNGFLLLLNRLLQHLVGPLGFSLEDKYVKRAGLDYWKHVDLEVTQKNIYTWIEKLEKLLLEKILRNAKKDSLPLLPLSCLSQSYIEARGSHTISFDVLFLRLYFISISVSISIFIYISISLRISISTSISISIYQCIPTYVSKPLSVVGT